MLSNVREDLPRAGAYYAHWCSLLMNMADEPFEVAIVGPDALAIKKEMAEHYLPNVLFCGTAKESDLMLLKNKFVPGETIIYVCKNKICKNPVKKTDEALAIIWSKDL